MKCTNCGNEIPEGASFCSACGEKVHNEYVVQDDEQNNQGGNGGYRQNRPADDLLGAGNGLAIASMVTGICSLVLSCCAGTFSFILAIVSCVLGIYVIVKHKGSKAMAIAGIACSGVAILVAIISSILYGVLYGLWGMAELGYGWY
ncbi:MAG: zinc-ribbon domain-containing protein [Oscillospiraceae bacterium]|nr:zinc-ribbon domain-containing protein [Oscillospiraceae bacterium]